ncbi:ParA family protein [Psychromonas sp. SP041]|uniref:ParA family protein n=1 Tax=Psychromonas sp. SP041 TaxID=1365007 RepID=UPI00041EBFD5|nr:ParA family protein [Psychromonas sp. SP041]
MAKVILVGANKGGVGKSTTCMNLAGCFANEGKKVVVIDTDANYTENGIVHEGRLSSQKFFLARQNAYEEQLPYIQCIVIPPNQKLNSQIKSLKEDGYDYIIIDTPGFSNTAFQSAAIAADKVLILTEPGRVSYDANLALSSKLTALEEMIALGYEDFTIDCLLVVNRFDAQKRPDLKPLKKFYALNLSKQFSFSVNTLNSVSAVTNAQNEFLSVFDDKKYKAARAMYSVLISELLNEKKPRWERGQEPDESLVKIINDQSIVD